MEMSEEARRNLEENRGRWGDRSVWEGRLRYGHEWSDQTHCRVVADTYLAPFLPNRGVGPDESPLDLFDILEIAPGGGRFTVELLRFASSLTLVDLNEACIQICRERFRYVDGIGYHVNDGSSLAMVPDGAFDVVASWDSFVHIDREIVERYVAQIHAKLRRGGIAWLHHAAAGPSDHGWRSNMSAALMRDYAVRYGLLVRAQIFRFPIEGPPPSYNDCISILTKP